ncbi:Hint domain-containing protein [Sulfitobacter sp. DFL-23]|uniref:Hint domain protein n=2 Tax=Pseudosulfitobacter pseudonitzschiae TaxID=1402135 RepID=A0A221K3Z9_9RHOB|nr:Hint domain-containing protein [Sulfitobacter sp. DFL-23]ASM73593.1 Hint domain protein [Pseudosulfitobacter pseudonitzschiae]
MAEIFDQPSKISLAELINPNGETGTTATWTDPNDGTSYTIRSGLHSNGTSNETNDNVKYQADPDGPVYIYTIHNNIRASIDDPETALEETAQHSALVTYVVNRDSDGNTTVEIQDIQSSFADTAGNTFSYPSGVTANLEMVSTTAGDVLTVQYTSPTSDYDNDGDFDQFSGRVNYTIDDTGNASSADARVWDATNRPGSQDDTVESDPDLVNINQDSDYAVEAGNFSVVYTSDGTPVLMQVGAPGNTNTNGAGNLTAINPDGTFGHTTELLYSSGATPDDDRALFELFNGNTEQGIQSATVNGKTFVYSSATDEFARAELVLDENGAPQLAEPVYFAGTPGAVIHADNSIFTGGVVGGGGNDRLLAAPDIGDGNSYMLLGDTATWQFFQVQPDGTLTPAGTESWTVSGEVPRNDLTVMTYEVDGQEYTGWLLQDPDNADDSWEFFHPDTGWVQVVPSSSGENPSSVSDHDFFMINGNPTWIGTSNRSLNLDSTSKPLVNYVADAGTLLICFAEGTMILTQKGERPIEALRIGDLVATLDHGFRPIRWIGARELSQADIASAPNLNPIRIKAGTLGDCSPITDLLVSPQHRVLVRSKIARRMFGADEVLIAAKQLCEIDGIEVAKDITSFKYYHMLFDQHEVVYSNGAETESLYTGPEALKSVSNEAREEILNLFPELKDAKISPPAARYLANGRMGRNLAMRHVKNGKPLVTPAAQCRL